jgi:hypothetical protein
MPATTEPGRLLWLAAPAIIAASAAVAASPM